MSNKQIYDLSNFLGIDVPVNIPCPYCGSPLEISTIDEYVTCEDGSIEIEHFDLECTSEPDMDDNYAWNNWNRRHRNMPYVYWLPTYEDVKRWLNDNFTFIASDPSKNDLKKLAHWVESVKGSAI